jgi:hypothetical protein
VHAYRAIEALHTESIVLINVRKQLSSGRPTIPVWGVCANIYQTLFIYLISVLQMCVHVIF